MPHCPHCQAEIAAEARFCAACGNGLTKEGVTEVLFKGTSVAESRSAAMTDTFPAAPRVRRLVAAAIDLVIGGIFLLPVAAMPLWMEPFMKANMFSNMIRFLPALYLLLRDSIGGRSLGKSLMGLVTYDRNLRQPATIIDSVVRNWPLALTLIPVVGWMISGALALVIAVQILLGLPGRLGDGFATTQVIDEKWLRRA